MNRSAAPVIIVNDLCKWYGTFEAVSNLSFSVLKGEIFGLLGPNGAGKSSTLEMLETLRKKTSGSVKIAGFDLDKDPAAIKSIIGVQLQTSGYYPSLKLTELIELFAGLYNRPTDPLTLLRKVNLEDKAKAKYKELSGGQKQRFSIATTNIREQGTTIILTTHYMDEAEYLCDRVAIMDRGKMVALDTPEVLIEKLLLSGFEPRKEVRQANLEDVFISLTGHALRDE
jgi:ABC-2 type transport system ATP-binding protein